MKRFLFSVLVMSGSLFFALTVLAAGGGGGGSAPSCTESIWSCNNWSPCSASGTQNRACEALLNCLTATNQKPAETQMCTSPPISDSKPVVATTSAPASSCTESTWECGDWSASCDPSGREHRSCHFITSCPQFPKSSPKTSQACQHLQCGNLKTLKERISCRVNLNPAGVIRELQIQYLPEECRVIANPSEKKECIERYKSYQPCWNLPEGQGRFECAYNVLKLSPKPLPEQLDSCKAATNKKECINDLHEKALYMIKFRFYDLEQRAEDLFYKSVSASDIADFDTKIETKKQEFDIAKNKEERLKIILDVRKAWQDFVNKAKNQVK